MQRRIWDLRRLVKYHQEKWKDYTTNSKYHRQKWKESVDEISQLIMKLRDEEGIIYGGMQYEKMEKR